MKNYPSTFISIITLSILTYCTNMVHANNITLSYSNAFVRDFDIGGVPLTLSANCDNCHVSLDTGDSLESDTCRLQFNSTAQSQTIRLYPVSTGTIEREEYVLITAYIFNNNSCSGVKQLIPVRRGNLGSAECSAVGDPHIKTFDNSVFSLYVSSP